MTPIILLEQLKLFSERAVQDLILPVRPQKGDENPAPRAPEVWKMSLPDKSAETQKAPYILLQLITGMDDQQPGDSPESTCNVRIVICVYGADGEEGSMNMLNVISRLRISLLKERVIGEQFTLRMPLEYLAYPDNTAPYFMGEMMTVWELKTIQREVAELWEGTTTPRPSAVQINCSPFSLEN